MHAYMRVPSSIGEFLTWTGYIIGGAVPAGTGPGLRGCHWAIRTGTHGMVGGAHDSLKIRRVTAGTFCFNHFIIFHYQQFKTK